MIFSIQSKFQKKTQQVGTDGQKNLMDFFAKCTDMFKMAI